MHTLVVLLMTPGIYPIDIAVNVNTHDIVYYLGPIPITVPVTTDLYSATGSYHIQGYEIEVSNTASENLTSKLIRYSYFIIRFK